MPKRITEVDPKKKKHPGGRPSKYKPEYCLVVKYMAIQGLTDVQMAKELKVSEKSFNEWKKKYPEFLQSLKKGKEIPDDEVEKSLFNRATGYSHDAVKIFMPAGAKEPVYAPYTERFPPDPTSMIFWLKNRRPDKWRDKRVEELELPPDSGLIILKGKMGVEEWQKNKKTTKE